MFTEKTDLKNLIINLQMFADGDEPADDADDAGLILDNVDDDTPPAGDTNNNPPAGDDPKGDPSSDTGTGDPGDNQPDPNKQDGEQPTNWEEQFKQKDADYQRLERRFTKVSQELSAVKSDLAALEYIKARPDLAQQVQALIDAYDDDNLPQIQAQSEVEKLKQDFAFEKELLRLESSDKVFAANKQAIYDHAEAEYGIDFETNKDPKMLKMVYNAWKGANAEQLAAKAALEAKKAAVKKQDDRQNAKLQGSTGPGKQNVDWSKMSDEQILAAHGFKSLIAEE